MNKNKELLSYYKKAKEFLDYNSEDGVFIRKSSRGGQPKGFVADNKHHSGYMYIHISINGKGKNISSHRLAWYFVYGYLPNNIDHIDMNRSNNSIDNLRDCSASQNNMNRDNQSNNTTGVKGVYWHKRDKKWTVSININKKQKHLCSTKNFEYACHVRKEAEIKHYGDFMRCNNMEVDHA